ncbi:hypothetical protein [Rhizobium bangladeshense]|uniref:hypothetical protein n=1 Tax=Rhizobium bangladeshense TaxID=1138189 RepID=UPI001C831AA4|nr:hypothetical protein [Rhizobium bangladeshense]MBX4899269.1 hypothetical protein [Rhizobium bangladeshense]MBY3617486.1 hypothetical protein [Rhizobium bangladeshense]
MDADPHYMQVVELWIAGQIGGTEMRERYAQLLRLRADKRAGRVLAPGLQPLSIGHEIEDGPDGSDESLQRMDEEPPAGFAPPRETD